MNGYQPEEEECGSSAGDRMGALMEWFCLCAVTCKLGEALWLLGMRAQRTWSTLQGGARSKGVWPSSSRVCHLHTGAALHL